MTALITLSHGSRHPQAVGLIDELSAAAANSAGVEGYSSHLEFNEPDLRTAVAEAIADGHKHMVIVPLLFTRGFTKKLMFRNNSLRCASRHSAPGRTWSLPTGWAPVLPWRNCCPG